MVTGWQFYVDRGGTFTDVVALSPDGVLHVHKLLSENPQRYSDATVQGIRDALTLKQDEPLPAGNIEFVRLGTTIATNALLERRGARSVLVTTKGFGDALYVGYQNRPDIFALNIQLPSVLFERVAEVDERIDAGGNTLRAPDLERLKADLLEAYQDGIRSCAIVFMHGYKYPQHEKLAEAVAGEIGFSNISTSHEVLPLMRFVSRGDTTTADAYLTPVLAEYVRGLSSALSDTRLYFMQSNGGLAAASHFRGKDSIVSGPAGGVVGAVKTAALCGETKVLTFDMGGTSTDVAHFNGEYERSADNEIAGVRIRAPMLDIHTVAAGGGSIVCYGPLGLKVGPESAGADPGPACYRRGGPLTVTDINLLLGRIQPNYFPAVFGAEGNQPPDKEAALNAFNRLVDDVARSTAAPIDRDALAYGCLRLAVEKMSMAIKQISTQKGHDPSEYALVCFGGAGGQHACMIAETLGITKVLIHPLAGVLSALGIGMADVTVLEELAVDERLSPLLVARLNVLKQQLQQAAAAKLEKQVGPCPDSQTKVTAFLKYDGTDFTLPVALTIAEEMQSAYNELHRQRHGFAQADKPIVVEKLSIEVIASSGGRTITMQNRNLGSEPLRPQDNVSVYFGSLFQQTPLYRRQQLSPKIHVDGPALIVDDNCTIVIEPGWSSIVLDDGTLKLVRPTGHAGKGAVRQVTQSRALGSDTLPGSDKPDPVLLEVFNNLFMFIAEQMGITLQNTSHSVNIKERLDFSCALFDEFGGLVANAPHIPVHLGSMGESVRELINRIGNRLKPGDVYALNDPYNGGTHLPDVTVLSGCFYGERPLFYVAARGHHADIGGITPGSMPPYSTALEQEGILLNMVKIASGGKLLEEPVLQLLASGRYPARNPQQNLADLEAQVASLQRGILEIEAMVNHYGVDTVRAYMRHVQDNAEEAVRRLIGSLRNGSYTSCLDNGAQISVNVEVDKTSRTATIDFTGTSAQTDDNFNAPRAICQAAVLYVVRTLVDQQIPLNQGCLKPLRIIIPSRSLLNPVYPAAVVAGNVETSQVIADTLYAALGKLAASQGTMNNFTFGNSKYQYYETICGGAGAGESFDGCDAVHTHMTNSRLTDPEVLEWRYPVLVRDFSRRKGSGGKGKHKGGDGAVRKIQFLQPMTASILSNRRATIPFGINGGFPGQPGKNYVIRSDNSITYLSACAEVEIQKGDVFVIETPGGGGFGAPES